MTQRIIKMGDRAFSVIRSTNESLTTKETQDSIKNGNRMIDIVLRDGRGSLLFCHEVKDVLFRDIDKSESIEVNINQEENQNERRDI